MSVPVPAAVVVRELMGVVSLLAAATMPTAKARRAAERILLVMDVARTND
jgi:hypothetical protein